jgi:DUF4097 and DUF4098 domain-containing protein YvlB
MRTKIIAVLLAILTALGGLNLFKSIQDRLLPSAKAAESSETYRISAGSDATEGKTERVRIKSTGSLSDTEGSDVMLDETFMVRDGQTLYMDVTHSDITIETGASGEARIRIMVSGANTARARDIFEEMKFSVSMTGEQVRVVSNRERDTWNRNDTNADIEIVAYIPTTFDLALTSTHGDVELEDIIGRVELNTTHGDLTASRIAGAYLSVVTTHGDIEADVLNSESIKLKTSHADIDVDEVASKRFTASTSHADVEIGELRGESDITTSHGDIRVALMTSSASDLRTSHGDIMLELPAGLKLDFDLEGASARLDRDFDFDGRIEDDQIRGSINGGGSKITARTTHGSVTIEKN